MQLRRRLFYPQLALTLVTSAFLIIPVIQSVLAGITNNYFVGIESGLTSRWLLEVWSLYRDTIFRSIFIGLACLAITLVVGVPAAYVMVKKQSWLTRLLEEFMVVPLAIPGLAIALALLLGYGRWTAFRQSAFIILAGHVIFTLPFMIRAVIAVMAVIRLQDLEEGAASLGAGFWQRFFKIIVPNATPGILAGSLMVFTLSIGEFNLTWMLHTPLTKTLPVGLADSYASMRLEIGSAYTIAFFVMIVPLLMAMQWVAAQAARPLTLTPKNKTDIMGTSLSSHRNTATAKPVQVQESLPDSTQVRLQACAKTFADGTRALRKTDLAIAGGETVVILGPSGCGKTTTLRIIAGLENPNVGGRVWFGDEDVTDIPIEKRNVGMVFQSYALFPNLNVADNIAYGLKVRGDSSAECRRRVDEMLAMMQIEALRLRRIDQLSGGQKQRVALARAIAVRPRVLLLDEPLTALDAKLRDALRIEIDMLLKQIGITAVYVTHDQGEAMALGDRIVVMDQGRIVQVGNPRQVYFAPVNRFVAEFIGSVNRIEVEKSNDRIFFPGGRLSLKNLPQLQGMLKKRMLLYFRPENAVVAAPGKGHFKAKVLSSFFMGDRTRLIVNGAAPRPLKIEAAGRQTFNEGQTVDIRLDLEALFTLEEAS
jgi:putative spermidine/putrescine transport system ATP-binding protein